MYDKSRHRNNTSSLPQVVDNSDMHMTEATPPDTDPADAHSDPPEVNTPTQRDPPLRRILPDQASYQLYTNWLAVIPQLIDDYLGYMEKSQGCIGHSLEMETYQCLGRCTVSKDWDVQCLYPECELFQTWLYLFANISLQTW